MSVLSAPDQIIHLVGRSSGPADLGGGLAHRESRAAADLAASTAGGWMPKLFVRDLDADTASL